jgi:hypothetical protein
LIAPGLEVYCSCFPIQNSKFLAFSCVIFCYTLKWPPSTSRQ